MQKVAGTDERLRFAMRSPANQRLAFQDVDDRFLLAVVVDAGARPSFDEEGSRPETGIGFVDVNPIEIPEVLVAREDQACGAGYSIRRSCAAYSSSFPPAGKILASDADGPVKRQKSNATFSPLTMAARSSASSFPRSPRSGWSRPAGEFHVRVPRSRR